MLTVSVDGPGYFPVQDELPLVFSLWDAPMLTVCVAGFSPLEDEATRLPPVFSLWAASPAFPGWFVGSDGQIAYSPGSYFRWLE